MPVGRVGVGGAEVTGGTEDFADVFGEVPAVSVPCAVFADGKGTRGAGLSWIPCEQPQARMAAAGEVTASNLEIAAVDVALMESDITVVDYFPCGVAP